MWPAYRQIWKALREGYDDDAPETSRVKITMSINIGDIIDCLQGVSTWQIEYLFEDHVRALMGKAIFTFASDLGLDLLLGLLTLDPGRRITAAEALRHPYFSEAPAACDPRLLPAFPSDHESR